MNNLKHPIARTGALAFCAISAVALSMTAAPALADDASVARLSLVSGTVTVQRADSNDVVAATLNAPVSVGDYVATSDGARAELQLDDQNVVRLGPDAQVRFTNLGAPANLLQLAQGTIEMRPLQITSGRPQVQTPSATIQPDVAGRYRVDVTGDGTTLLAVRSGVADVVTPQGTQKIGAGTTVRISGQSSDPQITSVQNIAYDDFDSWNSERDRYALSGANEPYADSGMVGLSDLDAYGHWVNYPSYGQVWVANSYPAGWAPYQYGRWVWQPYYGWTWVGYEPWGWAPYHYGRWFYAPRVGWAWYPGPVYVRPVYRPALVAFFGFGGGGGFSFNFAFGNVGWVPLAPYEDYHPWWGPGYGRRPIVYNNVTNITNITNISNVNITKVYRNASAPHGVAVVSHENFTNGNIYHYVPVKAGDLNNVALVKGVVPVAPTKQNLAFTQGGHVSNPVPLSSHFKTLPAPTKLPPTFDQQRLTAQNIVQHTYPAGVKNTNPVANPNAITNANGTNGTTHTTGSPWDRFNSGSTNGSTLNTSSTLNKGAINSVNGVNSGNPGNSVNTYKPAKYHYTKKPAVVHPPKPTPKHTSPPKPPPPHGNG